MGSYKKVPLFSTILLLSIVSVCYSRGYYDGYSDGYSRGYAIPRQFLDPMARVKMAYCVVDPPPGYAKDLPPVILLHGMLDSKLTWALLAPKIATYTGRRVYYIDARNHGDSPWSNTFNFDILSDDLEQFMDDRDIPKAVLVGHSMGGKTAITAALRHPSRIEKIIVEDMTVRNMSNTAGGFVLQTLKMLRQSLTVVPPGVDEITARHMIAKFLSEFLPPEQMPQTEEGKALTIMKAPITQIGGQYVWKTNLDVIENSLLTRGNFDQTLEGRFDGGTLFLYGEQSFFGVDKDEPLIKQFFPNAKLFGVPSAGHLIHNTHPQIFMKEVVEFINGYQTSPQHINRLRSKY